MSILLTIFILGVIILIHELGHFLAARMFKIPVSEFAIGMGPKLFTYHGKATDYTIRMIPMGGFVNIEGMEADNKKVESKKEIESNKTEELSLEEIEINNKKANGFNSKKPWQRFIVLFAGVFMNFVLAFVITFVSTVGSGEYTVRQEPIIGKVSDNSKAKGILAEGDKILNIDGMEIKKWDDLTKFIQANKKDKVEVEILRAGVKEKKEIGLTYDTQRKQYLIGIQSVIDFRKYTLKEGIKQSFVNYKELFGSVMMGFEMLIKGQVKAEEMTGPVGLVKVVSDIKQNNSSFLIWLTALLSVNVGIFNLLPFPALDGGRIIFVIVEMFGVKVNKKWEEKVHLVGIILLIALFLVIMGNDIKKFF